MMDSILFWNAVALEANRVSFSDPAKAEQQGPTLSSRALAIVHLAMYDAYAGIVGGAGFPRYLAPPATVPAPAGSSAQNAVAGAAFKTLSELYTMQKDYFKDQLACFDEDDPSFKFGMEVGKAVWELRSNDPGAGSDGYKTSPNRYRHRVDPDNPDQGFHAPFYGIYSKNFAVTHRHALDKPYSTSGGTIDPHYLAALRQVRAKGIRPDLTGTLPDKVSSPTVNLFAERRTGDETTIGIFWGYDGANRLGTPPRFFNQIIRQVVMNIKNPATSALNDEGQNARLFAFANAAMGDAGILAWEQKYCHDFWRPVVGIREHDELYGPKAPYKNEKANPEDCDSDWLPLGAPSTNLSPKKNFTPNFPAYPSGHATFGAAALHITRLFYSVSSGDRAKDKLFKDLTLVSEEFNGKNRDNQSAVRPYHAREFKDGLWQMIIENGLSRVFLGVHWVFDALDLKVNKGLVVPDLSISNDKIGGIGLGIRIAEDIFNAGNKLAPVLSGVGPTIPSTAPVTQPASVKGCAGVEKDEEKLQVEDRFLQGLSTR